MSFLSLDPPDLTPHGFCLAWDPFLLRLHVASDLAIALSYYSIPVALCYFVLRRRDLAFRWVFWLFGVFISACGTTHLLDIWTLWYPDYELQGGVKAATALVSVIAAALLWPLIPKALTLPSPAVLRLVNDRLVQEAFKKDAAMLALQTETADRRRAEDMLRQSQKMQAIGHLTGGVAHDFSNLLMVVQGNLEVLRARLGDNKALDKYIDRSLRSIAQGSVLTGQLLSFARQQPLKPVDFDLNARVGGFSEVMPITLGASIELELRLAQDLWLAEADPNQLESALLNLVINARDAMPQGGRLLIETFNVSLGHAELGAQTEAEPGDFVALAVSDTGTGMSAEVREQVFEPFFTTKPVGSGSGLGLSQLYGFVQQSHGHVTLDSKLGEGTTVTIYLRRSVASVLGEVAA